MASQTRHFLGNLSARLVYARPLTNDANYDHTVPDEPTLIPPRHPFATCYIDGKEHPALILAWTRIPDANGMRNLYARVAYAVDGEAAFALVPAQRVKKAG